MARTNRRDPALMIDDAGLGSLVVAVTIEDPARLTPWIAPPRPQDAQRVRQIVNRRAEALGLATPVLARERTLPDTQGPLATTRTLLDALAYASSEGLQAVLWPVHVGADLDVLMRTADLARLVGTLTTLELGPGAPRLETPLLDLTDEQVAEMALDAQAPLGEGWWLAQDPGRWARALDDARARLRPAMDPVHR